LVAIIAVSAIVGGYLVFASQIQTATPGSGWQIVKKDVTIHGYPAFIGRCSVVNFVSTSLNSSLVVDLIKYNGSYYYAYTGTFYIGDSSATTTVTRTDSTGGVSVTTIGPSAVTPVNYTAWFTNSTLFCVTPARFWNVTCPGG
jgi:hypothetical protein